VLRRPQSEGANLSAGRHQQPGEKER
jgi:hypothetical protein